MLQSAAVRGHARVWLQLRAAVRITSAAEVQSLQLLHLKAAANTFMRAEVFGFICFQYIEIDTFYTDCYEVC